jgi:hypothetical protein
MPIKAVVGLSLVLGNTALAMGSVLVYCNDFEGAVGPEWSNPGVAATPTGRHFLGQDATYGFANSNVTLTVDLPADTAHVSVAFDVYVIGSWNGSGAPRGPDLFYFSAPADGGPTSVLTTFSNMDGQSQAYPDPFGLGSHPRWTGAVEHGTLGYSNELDAVYHFDITFPYSGRSLTVAFGAVGLEPFNDETWGLDNVHLSAEAHLPEPTTMLLLAPLACIYRRRPRAVLAR